MEETTARTRKELEHVIVRFAGDSGDGIQLTGKQFTRTTAIARNELNTLPDFPAEIRAPAGTLHGVSSFQIHFGREHIHTPGDKVDVLVAMNPAALKANLRYLRDNAIIIVNVDAFTGKNLRLAGYEKNPLESGELSAYQVYPIEITTYTLKALEEVELSHKEKERCKNFFALGVVYWLFDRPLEPTVKWIQSKFSRNAVLAEANVRALKAGRNFADSTELFHSAFRVLPAEIPPGLYRNITGNEALVLGLISAGEKSGLSIYYASYPITPASDVLHMIGVYKNFGVITFQAEDEISAIGSALGAAFAGKIGVTATSGPGLSLKTEFMGLAVMMELPLVVLDIQRAGPSTGMPTKTEQADLLMAMFGRHGEAPVPIVAACSPSDCFYAAYEAVQVALRFMTPVVVLSDGFLANGSEPWRIPDPKDLPPIQVKFMEPNGPFFPYQRDPVTLARNWAVPGTPGLEHRLGGLEKEDVTGNVSYDPENHDKMVRLRAEKIERVGHFVPEPEIFGPEEGDVLLVSWGSTYGTVLTVVEQLQRQGHAVSMYHLRWVNPMPEKLGRYLKRFRRVVIPEINLGQLATLIRSKYLVDAVSFDRVRGLPLQVAELTEFVKSLLED